MSSDEVCALILRPRGDKTRSRIAIRGLLARVRSDLRRALANYPPPTGLFLVATPAEIGMFAARAGGALLDADLVREVLRRWPLARFATGGKWLKTPRGGAARVTYAFSLWSTVALLAPLSTSPTSRDRKPR